MLSLLLLLVLLGGFSCSKDRPPTAPAGKSTSDFSDLFDLFDSLQESDGDTASDSTASSSPDSSSSSDSTSSAPDSLVFSPPAAVAIPDAALRRYIEKVLKKRRGATITQADMRTLVSLLDGHGLGIKSLIGLEAATNLQNVAMGGNQIADVTPLVHLPKLRYLYLKGNPLSDASIDEHIPALERRGVTVVPAYLSPPDAVLIPDVRLRTAIEVALNKRRRQPITQAEMETLVELYGGSSNIRSLIGLESATNLQELYLSRNLISDVTPLVNLPRLQTLYLENNPLSDASIDEHISALQRRGVEVKFSPSFRLFTDRDSPFDIELVFLDDFTEIEQETWHQVAHRWEAAIQMDLPDYTFSGSYSTECGGHSISIPAGKQIDDLRIYITKFDGIDHYGRNAGGYGGPRLSRRSSSMPIIGCIGINGRHPHEFVNTWRVGLHEIGHVLGIGYTWRSMLRDLNGDTYFAGPQAITAFDHAGGTDYQGAKVPVERHSNPSFDKAHWKSSVMIGELMSTSGSSRALSAITLGALSDLGYTVDFSAANPYELPPPSAAKPVADAVPFCSVKVLPAPVYVDD